MESAYAIVAQRGVGAYPGGGCLCYRVVQNRAVGAVPRE